METYKKEIATNDQVELIHVSLDSSDDAAEKWAEKHNFPWPTIMNHKAEKSGLEEFKGRGVPHYALIDKNGKEITTGKTDSFAKIKELTK